MRKAVVDFDNTHFEMIVNDVTINNNLSRLPTVLLTGILDNGQIITSPKGVYIEKVIFNDPATIIYWNDKTRTVVKCQPGDTFDPKIGFLMAVCKKGFGNTGKFNELLKKYVPGYSKYPSQEHMRKKLGKFCRNYTFCSECPLNVPCRCGRGAFFTKEKGDSAYMTDDEIIKAYEIAFNKGGKHE